MTTMLMNDMIKLLQELLEAERAGARVALDTLNETDDDGQKSLLNQIHIGEAESCRRIRDCIKYLGSEPSVNLGIFYENAMMIESITDRLYFIDRGQRWVINKIKDSLESIDNKFVRKELANVLRIHVLNSDAFNLVYT